MPQSRGIKDRPERVFEAVRRLQGLHVVCEDGCTRENWGVDRKVDRNVGHGELCVYFLRFWFNLIEYIYWELQLPQSKIEI